MADAQREFEKRQEVTEFTKAFQTLIDRMKLRQWCVEQAIAAKDADPLALAKAMFDFCCEDIEAWLARNTN